MNVHSGTTSRISEDDPTLLKLREARKGATGELKRCLDQAIEERERKLQNEKPNSKRRKSHRT